MQSANTLADMLAVRAQKTPEQTAFTFDDITYTYDHLYQESGRYANHLTSLGLEAGERVVLALPNGPEFLATFYGILRLGCVAVPVYHESGRERLKSIVALSGAKGLVLSSSMSEANLAHMQGMAEAGGYWVSMFREARGQSPELETPTIDPAQIAFIQYTSGSTGDPKGVQLSHYDLITNVRQMVEGMAITSDDVFVSWLPVYHDMGLILKTMAPLYVGAPLHLLPASLTRVKVWLSAIEKHGATFTAAPDFAYRLCLRYIREPGQFNLKSLRVALNAAEPVRASTLAEFQEAFGLQHVMAPAYGLAEATVGVSMWTPGTPALIDARGQVSVGRPFPGVSTKIIDENNQLLPPGQVGEIAIKSLSNCEGYLGNEAATQALFMDDGYFHSGDMGYMDSDDYLFVVGRAKNVIISAGETIAPKEVQEAVERDDRVRFSAAVGVDRGHVEGEQVYLFVEARGIASLSEDERYEIALDLVNLVKSHLGMRPGRLYLVKPHTIPRTPNGKIQHLKLKEAYISGQLREEGRILFPDY